MAEGNEIDPKVLEELRKKGFIPLNEEAQKFKDKMDELSESIINSVKAGERFSDLKKEIEDVKASGHNLTEQYKAASEAIYKASGSMRDLSGHVRVHKKVLQDEIVQYTERIKVTETLIHAMRLELAAMDQETEAAARLTEAIIELTNQKTEEIEKLEEATEKRESYNEILNQTESTVTLLTGVNDKWKKTLVGSVIASGNLAKGMTAVAAQMQKQLTLGNMLGSTMMKVQEQTLMLAKAENQADVAMQMYSNSTEAARDSSLLMARSNRALGFSTKEAAESHTELYNVVFSFSSLQTEAQNELTKLNATMARFGVSSRSGAASASFLMDVLGKTVGEVNQFQAELEYFGSQIGKTTATLNQEFAESRKSLILYGNRAVEVFKRMSATAKALKVDVSQLTGAFEDQFNTFEGAFTSVGKLNSLLNQEGVQLDAIAMMSADADERMRMFSETIQGTSLAYEALHGPQAKFHRLAIANALGTQDLDLVVKALQGDLGKLAENVDYATKSYQEFMSDEFLSKAKSQQDVWMKLKLAAEQFGISMLPVIRVLSEGITMFNEFMDALGPVKNVLAFLITGFLLYKTVMMIVVAAKGIYTGVTFLAGKANLFEAQTGMLNNTVSKGTLRLAKANRAAAQARMATMAGLAVVLIGLGAALFLAGKGAEALGNGLRGLNSEQLQAFMIIAATGGAVILAFSTMVLLGAGMLAGAAKPLAIFGAVLFLIGAAVAIAALGLSTLVDSIAKLGPESASSLLMTSAALGAMASSMVGIAAVGLFASLGVSAMASSLSSLGEAVGGEEGSKGLVAFSSILKDLGTMNFDKTKSGIESVSTAVTDLANKMDGLSDKQVARIISVGSVFSGNSVATKTSPASTGVATVEPESAGVSTPSPAPPVNTPAPGASKTASADISALSGQISQLVAALNKFANRNVVLNMTSRGTKTMVAKVEEEMSMNAT